MKGIPTIEGLGRHSAMGGQLRQEHDSMGCVEVPAEALWGAQTQRSCNNFAIGNQLIPAELIHALARIKGCCAEINGRHQLLTAQQVQAIERAAAAITEGTHDNQFPLSVWQTGSGTQTSQICPKHLPQISQQYPPNLPQTSQQHRRTVKKYRSCLAEL